VQSNLQAHCLDYIVIIFGTVVGAGFGLMMTIIVMSTLVMISISGYFNLYYGLLLSSLGCVMIFNIYRKNKIVELDGADHTGTKMSQRTINRLDNQPANSQFNDDSQDKGKAKGGVAAGILHEPMALNDSVMLS